MALSYTQVKQGLDAAAAETGGKFIAFDAAYYVANYSVVRDSNGNIVDDSLSNFEGDPLQHYVEQGAGRGYAPNAWFDATYYRSAYSDTTQLAAGDLLVHYALHGVNEGRAPNAGLTYFDGDRYLEENPDVLPYVQEHLDDMFGGSYTNGALAHWIKFGNAEQRPAYDLGGNDISLTPNPPTDEIGGITIGDTTWVSLDTNGGDTTLTGNRVVIDGGDGISTLRLTGDAALRIDMTNSDNQVRGIDLNGDGVIAANGVENNVSGAGIVTFKNFEVIDAYARNPLNEGDASNNYLGDIKYDGTGVDGDGVSTDGNIYLGGLGRDEVLAGIGNDFLAGGGIAGRDGTGLPSQLFYGYWDSLDTGYEVGDFLSGGRNADFMYGEFASLDNVDGTINIFDGGTTSDDTSAGQNSYTEDYSSQDSDWILLEISDDEEFADVVLNHWQDYPGEEGPYYYDHPSEWFDDIVDAYGMDGWIAVGDGKRLRGLMDDVENVDASGNLYGFLDDYDVELGSRRLDDRDEDGLANYGLGSSGQLRIYGSDESNKLIGGYDNDFISGGAGNDLLFGGNMQFFSETVEDGVTNPNLAGIWNDGRDELVGGDGRDDILFETDGGIYEGGSVYDSDDSSTDTLWVTNYVFGTKTAADVTSDGVIRLDLDNGKEPTDADNANNRALNYKGYGGADANSATGTYTSDQTNYKGGVARAQVQDMESVIATGLGDVDYKAAGGNSPELNFDNQQNFFGYEGDLDLRGGSGNNVMYANTGNDTLEGREGNDSLMGGLGNDDFYFSLDGAEGSSFTTSGDFCDEGEGRDFANYVPGSGEGLDVIHRQRDANGDNLWDTDYRFEQDFGNQTTSIGTSVLALSITRPDGNLPNDELVDVVQRVDEIRTGIKLEGESTFTPIVINTAELRAADTYAELTAAINDALDATPWGDDLEAELQADGYTIFISDAQGRELADEATEADAGVSVTQYGNTGSRNDLEYGPAPELISQDRIIYKAYEDRTDNEGVDDDSVFGSLISLGKDNYAEDLVVDFQTDNSGPPGSSGITTYLSEDQAWSIGFQNLTTQDLVTITVNGVKFTLQVGRDLSGNLISAEDTQSNSLSGVQEHFLQRMASFITGQLDDDTAAGGLDVRYTNSTLTIVPRDYDAEEVVFIRKPTVAIQNLSGGEPATYSVSNKTQHELQLYQFDGQNNRLNETNVLFWGQEEIQRANLETAKTTGGTLTGLDATVINSGTDDILDVDYNRTTSYATDFVVHGDDQFFGADGDDAIYGLTGDDRFYGSRGDDMIDGGKDLYKVREIGASKATVESMNDYDAAQRDAQPNVASVSLLLQVEGGGLVSDSRPTEGYFRDTLIFQQRDFGDVGEGGATFTIEMSDDLDREHGGEGWVEVFEGGVLTGTTYFVEMENIRTVSGDGTWEGQGNDTLDVQDLSDATEIYDTSKAQNGGLTYYLTSDDNSGKIVINYTGDVYAKVDGVENVLYGDGDDVTYIDETEAGKDNLISGGLGSDEVWYDHEDVCCELLPQVTLVVESATNTDEVVMTGGILGTDTPTDTLRSIETVSVADMAVGHHLNDVLDVSNVDGAIVDFHGVDPVYEDDPDWSGANVRESEASNNLLISILGMDEFERVHGSADSDTVIVADTMDNDACDVDGWGQIEFDSILNFDQLGDDCERLTLGDIRASNEDPGNIPDAYWIETYQYDLAGDVDRVDYSHETGFVIAVVNFDDADDDEGNPTHVLVNNDYSEFEDIGWEPDLLDDWNDRVDLLKNTEEIVASQYREVEFQIDGFEGTAGVGGVIDLTQSDRDIALTYSYGDEEDLEDPSLDRQVRVVHLQDMTTDTPINEVNFLEYEDLGDDDDIDQVAAYWTRVEGSDNNEMVELTDHESDIGHFFNLRGGDNEVNYNELTRSIFLTIEEISDWDEENCDTTGLITARVEATNGEYDIFGFGDPDILGEDWIRSHNATNGITGTDGEVAAGTLRIEASQDKEDAVAFNVDLSQFYLFRTNVDGSDELEVSFGDPDGELTLTLTGFEYLIDSDSDDTYTVEDFSSTLSQYTFFDNTFFGGPDDRDTIVINDDWLDYADDDEVVSLWELNYEFFMDFDVVDMRAVTENNLVVIGDTPFDYDSVQVEVDPPGDDTTQSLLGNGTLTVDIAAADQDWFQIEMIEGETYRIYTSNNAGDPVLELIDRDGSTVLDTDDDSGDGLNSLIIYTAEQDGTYYVNARSFGGGVAQYDLTAVADRDSTLNPVDGHADDVIVGDLDLIDEVWYFQDIWLSDASVAEYDSLVLNIDEQELQDEDGDAIFETDAVGLNASLVTSGPVQLSVVDSAGVGARLVGSDDDDVLNGSGGDDTMVGGAGADQMDGGVVPEVRETLIFDLQGATSSQADDTAYVEISDGTGAIRFFQDGSIQGDATGAFAGSEVTLSGSGISALASADAVAQAIGSVSAANWATYLPAFEIDHVEIDTAGAGASVTFVYASEEDPAPSDLTIGHVEGAAADSNMEANLTPIGGATVDSAQGDEYAPQEDSADTFVYQAASDSTQASMDSIDNFNIDSGAGSLDDVINLYALSNAGGGNLEGNSLSVSNTEQASLAAILTAAEAANAEVYVGRTANDAYVIVDANDSGTIQSSDMVIKLVGVSDVSGVSLAENFDFVNPIAV